MKVFPLAGLIACTMLACPTRAQTVAYYAPTYTAAYQPASGMSGCFYDETTGEYRTPYYDCPTVTPTKTKAEVPSYATARIPSPAAKIQLSPAKKFSILNTGNDLYAFNEESGELWKFVPDVQQRNKGTWTSVTDSITGSVPKPPTSPVTQAPTPAEPSPSK